MNGSWGISHFMAQGDAVSHGVAVVLLLLSVLSWSCIVRKALSHWRLRRAMQAALTAYQQAGCPASALAQLLQPDSKGLLAGMVHEAQQAAQAYARQTAAPDAGLDEFVGRTLQHALVRAQIMLEQGLTVMASAGSIAPFVGLLGTVWGIYHALTGLSGAGQMRLDQVAGPVGEALIMTAVGLFVAIPAVLAYNAFTRSNRLLLAQLDAFAHSLHACLVLGIHPAQLQPLPDVKGAA